MEWILQVGFSLRIFSVIVALENPLRWAYDRENPAAVSVETKERWAA